MKNNAFLLNHFSTDPIVMFIRKTSAKYKDMFYIHQVFGFVIEKICKCN